MLPLSVKGEQRISEDVLRHLSQRDVRPISKVIIYRNVNGKEYPTEVTNVTGYEVSDERQFGASELTISATNENGEYSYANINSDKNKLYTNGSQEVSVSLSSGTFNNTAYSAGLVVVGGEESGEWISEPINGGAGFSNWNSIEWDLYIGTHNKGGVTYYGTVNMFVRFGDSANNWTDWIGVAGITADTGHTTRKTITSSMPYVQIRCVLHKAYGMSSPRINSITLHKTVRTGSSTYSPLYYYGNRIEVYESVVGEDGSIVNGGEFKIFNGFIDEVSPSQVGEELSLTCKALDFMKICLNDIIETDSTTLATKKFKDTVELEVLPPGEHEDGVIVTEDEVNSVFRVPREHRNNGPIRGYPSSDPRGTSLGDFKYRPWVERPAPIIKVDGQVVREGFQIDYSRGVVYFTSKQEKDGAPKKVEATFHWVDLSTNLFEDVVGEIIAMAIEKFGYEKPKRTVRNVEHGYDVWEVVGGGGGLPQPKIIIEHSHPRVTIPDLIYTIDDNKTFFDALEEVKKYIQPDYMIRATPEGNFVGEYLPQKGTADYQLTLVSSMSAPVSEDYIYTKCIARGVYPFTRNVALDATPTMHTQGANTSYYPKNAKLIIDGDTRTYTGLSWASSLSGPRPVFTIQLKEPIIIGAVNVLCGPPRNGSADYSMEIGFVLEVSDNGTDWYELSERHVEFRGTTAQWIRVEKDSFYNDVREKPMRYVRVVATYAPRVKMDLLNILSSYRYCFSISEIQVFPDEEIRVEVTLDDLVKAGDISQSLATDMMRRVGVKTIVLPVNSTLRDEDMVKRRALDTLYESARNLYTSEAEVVYAPHIKVGHTVSLYNPKLISAQAGFEEGRRLYYVEGVRRRMEGNIPSVSVTLVSWT